ncbi:hypothetical protein JXI42_06105 [bacterium]|nr:hypothetical protein [bacterium]
MLLPKMGPGYTHTKLYERDATFSHNAVIIALSTDYHLINHYGHSDYDLNLGLNRTDINGLRNSEPYIGYSIGCWAYAFDERVSGADGSIVSCMLNAVNAASGFVGNTRYGWGYPSSPYGGPSFELHTQYTHALYRCGYAYLGQALAKSKEFYTEYATNAYARSVNYSSNLCGDPMSPVNRNPDYKSCYVRNIGSVELIVDSIYHRNTDYNIEIYPNNFSVSPNDSQKVYLNFFSGGLNAYMITDSIYFSSNDFDCSNKIIPFSSIHYYNLEPYSMVPGPADSIPVNFTGDTVRKGEIDTVICEAWGYYANGGLSIDGFHWVMFQLATTEDAELLDYYQSYNEIFKIPVDTMKSGSYFIEFRTYSIYGIDTLLSDPIYRQIVIEPHYRYDYIVNRRGDLVFCPDFGEEIIKIFNYQEDNIDLGLKVEAINIAMTDSVITDSTFRPDSTDSINYAYDRCAVYLVMNNRNIHPLPYGFASNDLLYQDSLVWADSVKFGGGGFNILGYEESLDISQYSENLWFLIKPAPFYTNRFWIFKVFVIKRVHLP